MPAMETRRIVLHRRTREKLRRAAKRCKDADTRVRYLIVLRAVDGYSGKRITKALGCSASTVSRTLDRWESYGEAGLVDRREDNGAVKADEQYVATVRWVLAGTPREFFHRRPTWTRALLIETARRYTGVAVSRAAAWTIEARVGDLLQRLVKSIPGAHLGQIRADAFTASNAGMPPEHFKKQSKTGRGQRIVRPEGSLDRDGAHGRVSRIEVRGDPFIRCHRRVIRRPERDCRSGGR